MLLQHPEIKVNVRDEINETPLHKAAESPCSRNVESLLNHPFILINQRNNLNETPLDLVTKMLRQAGPGVDELQL